MIYYNGRHKNQKNNVPPRLKSRGLIGTCFIKNNLVFECHRNVGALRGLDAHGTTSP